MKGRFFAATVFSALVLTACSVDGSKENAVDKSEVNKVNEEVTLKPENINLGVILGEDTVAGRIEVYEFDNFRLHVYYTQDVMNDASYIVEGTDSVVTMEHPLFRVNVREFDTYLEKLAKPVAKRIADYHIGGTGDNEVTMMEGMPAFAKAPVYGGMMSGFEQAFGDSMTDLPTGKEDEVNFGTTRIYASVPFEFLHGASSDFPAASIIIGDKVYYTHWTPAKAHMSHLQLVSRAAVDAEIAEAERELNSGAVLFIGGHGGATSKEAVEFKIEYLNAVRRIMESAKTADEFATRLDSAYPGLPGSEGVKDLAAVLYK